MCPSPSNLPTYTEAATTPCGAEMRKVCVVALRLCRSTAGAKLMRVPLASKKAMPAVPTPELTAAVTRRVYSVAPVCVHSRALPHDGCRSATL